MAGAITWYEVRDPDISAGRDTSEPYSAGYRHDGPGLRDARQWAAEHSAGGRELVIVELVDGEAKGELVRYKDGREV
jgi:hypothetical protein